MKRYRLRPIEDTVEAVQWTGKNLDEIKEFVEDCGLEILEVGKDEGILLFQNGKTKFGRLIKSARHILLKLNGWMIKTDGGFFNTFTDQEFQRKYEEEVNG